MPRYNTEALILKAKRYGEADKLYTLFTKEKGKIIASGKGVRKISSRRGSNLDSLNHVRLGIYQSTKGYKVINEAETINSYKNIKKDLQISTHAFYISELINKFLPDHEENQQVFNLALKTLDSLEKGTNNHSKIINAFEISFMNLNGYDLTLDRCVICNKDLDENWNHYKFSIDRGGIICDTCQNIGVGITKETTAALYLLKHKKIFLSRNPDFTSAHELLQFYIRHIIEDEFNSKKFFI